MINVVSKYLRQFLGTSFGVPTLPIYCNIAVCTQCCLQVSETVSGHKLRCCYSSNILQHYCLQTMLFASIYNSFWTQASVLLLFQYPATLLFAHNVIGKYLRQFLGTSFGVATLPISCNIVVCKQCCLQVSETVSGHKLRCCYSSNILQHCCLQTMLFAGI